MEEKTIKLTHEEVKAARPGIEELSKGSRLPVTVLLENIRSLYNVGSMFRTCDGAAVERLILSGYTGIPPRKEIDKTALGSVESVPWSQCPDPVKAIGELRALGYQIVVLEHTNRSVSYTEASYRFPLCLVLGNEVTGVSDEVVAEADLSVEIPMFGIKQSLNVAVACGIALFNLVQEYSKMPRLT